MLLNSEYLCSIIHSKCLFRRIESNKSILTLNKRLLDYDLQKHPPQSTKHFLLCLLTVHFLLSWSLQVRPATAEEKCNVTSFIDNSTLTIRAWKRTIRRFVITEKALISCVGNPISCLLTVGSTPSKGLLRDCEIFAKLRISFLSVHVLTVRTLAGVLDGQVVRHILHDYE